jgi:VWFA-related protein
MSLESADRVMLPQKQSIMIKHSAICLPCIVAVIVFSGFSAEQKSQKNDQTIRVNVEMVSLPVVVSDKAGNRMTNLKKDDFQVYENGTRQEITAFAVTDEPICVALMLDTSYSMKKELAKIQNAAISFVSKLHPDDKVAVFSFDNDVRLLQEFTGDRDKIKCGIRKPIPKDMDTATVLYDAVGLALKGLKPLRERKALVIFTDGIDTGSGKNTKGKTLGLATESSPPIYCVYYNTEQQYSIHASHLDFAGSNYLHNLAKYNGGLVLQGRTNLDRAFDQIAKELASQYSLGYYSSDPRRDGQFRSIRVKLSKPGLVARTKKGYYTENDRK